MRLIPGVPGTLVAIKRMEEGRDDLHNSADLCWLFCNSDFSVKGFKERLTFEFNNIQEKKGEYLDPEITSLVVRGAQEPDKVASLLANRLDALALKKQAPYAGQIDDPKAVFVSTHLEAARLISIIEDEGFSDNARQVLKGALDSFSRCEYATEIAGTTPWPDYLTVSLKGVGCLLLTVQFSIYHHDGDYEEALVLFPRAIDSFSDAKESFNAVQAEEFKRLRARPRNVKADEPVELTEHDYLVHSVKSALSNVFGASNLGLSSTYVAAGSPPWLRAFTFQAPADCFEAVRSRARVRDSKALASACRRLIGICQSSSPVLRGDRLVSDARGDNWEPDVYWYHALGWAEALLNPSDLRESLQQGEDVAAERRMRAYFFEDRHWSALPKRAKSSLVNADRDYFAGAMSRREAVLNELRVATEEILFHGLWTPLGKWITENDERRASGHDFIALEEGLRRKRHSPTLFHFEKMCRMDITARFFSERGYTKMECSWLSDELPGILENLRKARDTAEHEPSGNVHADLRKYFNRYLGIQQPGLLSRLASLLYVELRER